MAALSLTSKQQRTIEILIRKWRTKLTWDLLVDVIKLECNIITTRQTLCTYTGIKNEYDRKKNELRGVTPAVVHEFTKSDVDQMKKLEMLEAENAVLKRQNAEQLRTIDRMLANASVIPNLDLNQLMNIRPEEV